MTLLLLSVLLTLNTEAMTAKAPSLSEQSSRAPACVSKSLLELKSAQGETWHYVISGTLERFLFHLSGHETLVIPTSEPAFIESRTSPYAKISRELTQRERDIVARLETEAGAAGLGAALQTCRQTPERDTRTPMAYPLSAEEKKTCKALTDELRDFKSCPSDKNCAEIDQKYFDGRERKAPRAFSFRQLVETGSGDIPIKMMALGAASAASWTWDFTVVRAILKNRANLVLTFGRAGVLVGGAGASAISFTFLPATAYVFGRDSCRAQKEEPDYADCLGRTVTQMTPVFRKQVTAAIEDPAVFTTLLENEKRAVESRLSCMLIETLVGSYESARRQVTCQGRTLDIGPGLSYIVEKDGELTRHQDGFYSHRFNPEAGTRQTIKRAQGIPDLRPTVKLQEELEMLQTLAPRIRQVLTTCQP